MQGSTTVSVCSPRFDDLMFAISRIADGEVVNDMKGVFYPFAMVDVNL